MIRFRLCPREDGSPGGRVRLLREVLEPGLFQAFQLYVRALSKTSVMQWEDWGHRLTRHNDPFAVLIHEKLSTMVSEIARRPVKKSYVYLACYGEGGVVPDHVDRVQCKYTLDLCLEDSGPPWPLVVDGRPYVFGENEGLFYLGIEQPHHRVVKPEGKTAHLAFFHFVDADFSGTLD